MIKFKVNKRMFREVEMNIAEMMRQVQRRAMKRALLFAATPALKAAKRRVPKSSGALRRALIKKGRTDDKRQMAFVDIGANKNHREVVNGKVVRPVRYAHLVEFGHRTQSGGFVAPRSFLRSLMSERGEMTRIFKSKIGPMVESEAEKAEKRQQRRRR